MEYNKEDANTYRFTADQDELIKLAQPDTQIS